MLGAARLNEIAINADDRIDKTKGVQLPNEGSARRQINTTETWRKRIQERALERQPKRLLELAILIRGRKIKPERSEINGIKRNGEMSQV